MAVLDPFDTYRTGAYLDDKAEIERLQRIMDDVLGTFVRSYIPRYLDWPYEIVAGKASGPSNSTSTRAMIIFALGVALGTVKSSFLVPAVRSAQEVVSGKTLVRLKKIVPEALEGLIQSLDQVSADDPLTKSATFGRDDPLTLTWLLELLNAYPEIADKPIGTSGDTHAARARRVARKRVKSAFEAPADAILELNPAAHESVIPHAFPLLRAVHLGRILERDSPERVTSNAKVRQALLDRLHLQLSLSSMPGSAFDAAELVFALEGYLDTEPEAKDLALVDRVFEILSERQLANEYWRPLRPLKVTPQGLVLLPQSVEIVNSLLRVCHGLDMSFGSSRFSDHLDLFKRYSRWIVAHLATVSKGSQRYTGWESEHTYAPDRIHLWQTSQALLFVQHYLAMLQQHVSRTTARAARLSPRVPSTKVTWTEFLQSEPVSGVPIESDYRIYQRIDADFVSPRRSGLTTRYPSTTMLLYGPPGTGKTRIAEQIADALAYRHLTITPSDFITAGQEGVEARAKAIFESIAELEDLVVVFDEIDQLLLDRESKFYEDQSDLFKMMTPGMLTKLTDLKKNPRNIYVIATNYHERIDRAIKRPGRIDRQYLVLPPDRVRREAYFARVAKDVWPRLSPSEKSDILGATALYSYKELDLLFQNVGDRFSTDAVRKKCSASPPTVSLGSYKPRLEGVHDNRPLEEFALVAYLLAQVDRLRGEINRIKGHSWAAPWIRQAISQGEVRDEEVANLLLKTIGSAMEMGYPSDRESDRQ
jgi:ATPase family associated with various cellular activities (AAA)